ncbi:MAG TPA: right-handed parallel beta-helix repeat-containing protein [bacterium]|nr:right-handed parallel beta-helix repeat-containing protein [bacterium]
MKASGFCVGLAAFVIALITITASATDWYVDAINGSNGNGGTSWADAWRTITYSRTIIGGLGREEDPCTLHAAPGLYSPSGNGETFPIYLGAGLSVDHNEFYSLAGAGAQLTTIDAESTEKAVVVRAHHTTISRVTITGGSYGGLVLDSSSPGGGPASFTLDHCIVRDNSRRGLRSVRAGLHCQFNDCAFTSNDSGPYHGGAMAFNYSNTILITNCLIAMNTTGLNGGGIYFYGEQKATLINCTIAHNEAHGLYKYASTGWVRLYNCIFWDNDDDIRFKEGLDYSISHCNISDGDGLGENGNISQDPLFVSGAQGDYNLSHAGVNAKKKDDK